MLKDLFSNLISLSKKFAKEHNVLDIVLYGSYARNKENPNDIDIVLIFLNMPLDERLKLAQVYKELLKNKFQNPDIKAINFTELFDSSFLARQGILTEGISLLDKTPLANKFGFEGYSLFNYNLLNLNNSKKTSFVYALSGRKKEGILDAVNAKHLGRGVVLVPISKSALFEDFLLHWNRKFKKDKILLSK